MTNIETVSDVDVKSYIGRPWRAQRSSRTDGRVIVRRSDGAWICDFDGENAMAFAELIVSAVNAHGQIGKQFGVEEGEILAAIAQKYRGDHNIETLFLILTRVAFERLQLLGALKELIEASGNMAPVGGEARYATAVERAEAALKATRAKGAVRQPPYGEWCRDPELCAGKGHCPRDPNCGE